MNTVEKLKEAIILINGALPEPSEYDLREIKRCPINHYKCVLRNLISDIPDEFHERTQHCSSRDCSEWDPEKCKGHCPSYHEEEYPTPKIQEVYP